MVLDCQELDSQAQEVVCPVVQMIEHPLPRPVRLCYPAPRIPWVQERLASRPQEWLLHCGEVVAAVEVRLWEA